jgi:hypothetical protein
MPQCPDCGLGYVPSFPSDARYHRRYHDKRVNGPQYKPLATDHTVWHPGGDRVTVVTPLSPHVQRKRAERVSLLAAPDVPFSFISYCADELPDDRNLHLFLGFSQDRAISFAKIEKRRHVWFRTWEQFDSHDPIERLAGHAPIWSVGFLWVCRSRRRQGWARRLLLEAAGFLSVNIDELGWYTPFTEAGEALARRLCPAGLFVAK